MFGLESKLKDGLKSRLGRTLLITGSAFLMYACGGDATPTSTLTPLPTNTGPAATATINPTSTPQRLIESTSAVTEQPEDTPTPERTYTLDNIATATPEPTNTPILPTETQVIPTQVYPDPTATQDPPTPTPVSPIATPVPTATIAPTATLVPPIATPLPQPDVSIDNIVYKQLWDKGNYTLEFDVQLRTQNTSVQDTRLIVTGIEGQLMYDGVDATRGVQINSELLPGQNSTVRLTGNLPPGIYNIGIEVMSDSEPSDYNSNNKKNLEFEVKEPIRTTQEVFDYVVETAASGEYSNVTRVFKYIEPIQLYLVGNPAQKYIERAHIAVNYLTNNGFDVEFVDSEEEANATAYLGVDHHEFENIFPFQPESILNTTGGLAEISKFSRDRAIKQVTIGVATNRMDGTPYTEQFVMHLIMEEIIQGLTGLRNDSDRYPGSIFYSDPNDKPLSLLLIDEAAIRYMSNDLIRPNMTAEQMRDVTLFVNAS